MTDEEDDIYLDSYALPPGPICSACGHDLCPCCPTPWCDTLTGERETPAADRELCCDGDCVVDAEDFRVWMRECRSVEEGWTRASGNYVTQAEGPWLPAAVRVERGLMLP